MEDMRGSFHSSTVRICAVQNKNSVFSEVKIHIYETEVKIHIHN